MPPTPYTFSGNQRHESAAQRRLDVDASGMAIPIWFSVQTILTGRIAALRNGDFAKAEQFFNKSLLFNKNDVTARFYMGVTKVKLEKWEEAAKRYLKTASARPAQVPDPKGYLGVTYAKLGNTKAALAQRASLLKMAEACQGTCEHFRLHCEQHQMIDEGAGAFLCRRAGMR